MTTKIPLAVDAIAKGRVVAFPTGTSYGLAADALQGWALQRVRQLKQRPQDKTFTVALKEKLWDKHLDLTKEEEQLLKASAGKPLTLLVKPKDSLEHLAQDGRVGVRVVDHPLMADFVDELDVPVTATSANRAGQDPAQSPAKVQEAFRNPMSDEALAAFGEPEPAGASGTTYDLSLALILDGGELPPAQPSTIARMENGDIQIVRPGSLSVDELQAELV